jgi:hypothetical protein
MTKALPTKDRITEIATEQGRKSYAISAELKLKKPAIPIISVDLGLYLLRMDTYQVPKLLMWKKLRTF